MYYGYGYINSSYMDAWLGLSMLSALLRNLKNDNSGQYGYSGFYDPHSFNPYRDSLFYHESRRSGGNNNPPPIQRRNVQSINDDTKVGNLLGGQPSQQAGTGNISSSQSASGTVTQGNNTGSLSSSANTGSNPTTISGEPSATSGNLAASNINGAGGTPATMSAGTNTPTNYGYTPRLTSAYSNSNNIFGQSAIPGNNPLGPNGQIPPYVQAMLKKSYDTDNAIGPFSLDAANGVYPWIGSIPPSGGFISGLPVQSTTPQIFGNPTNNGVILNPALTTLTTNYQVDIMPYSMLAPYMWKTQTPQQQQQRVQQPRVVGQQQRAMVQQQGSGQRAQAQAQPQIQTQRQTSGSQQGPKASQQSFTSKQPTPQQTTSKDTSVTYKRNGHVKLGKAVQQRLQQIAQKVNCNYEDIFGVMYKESGFRTVPTNWDGKRAVGLLQWTDIAIKDLNQVYGLNLTKAKIARMSIMQQLDLAELTLQREKVVAGFDSNQRLTSGQLYAMNYVPKGAKSNVVARKGDGNYEGNEGLDINGDGNITQVELNRRVSRGKAFMDLA